VPATDAAGKPLVGAAPETTAGKTRADAEAAAAAQAAKLSLDEATTKANELIARVDGGGKMTRKELQGIGAGLGITFPFSATSNQAKFDIIRAHLGQQGAPSVSTTGPLDQTGGAGAGMAGKPGAIDTAGGTTAAKPGGVDVAGAVTTTTPAGEGAKPGAVTPTTSAGLQEQFFVGFSDDLVARVANDPKLSADLRKDAAEELKRRKAAAAPSASGGSRETFDRNSIADGEYVITRAGITPLRVGQKVNAEKLRNFVSEYGDEFSFAPAISFAPATSKTIADLSPELQAEVQRRQDEIARIEDEGGDASKQKKFLNIFLQRQGVTGTLSAKKSIKKDFLEQGELPYAVAGEEKTEQQQEQERVAAYEESLGKTVPKYDLTDEDQRLYNEVREEANAQAEAANKRREELVQKLNEAVAAYDALDTDNDAELQAAVEKVAAAENALIEHGGVQRMLPEYSKKFAADYKDVYFGNIKYGNKAEHRKAAKALQDYLSRTGGRDKEEVGAQERRIINHYEENRAQYSKIFPVNFPRWQDLTAEQKEIFMREMKTLAGVQQDVAFAKLGVKLIEDSKQLSEGEKREKQNEINRKAEVAAESEQTQAELEELRRKAPVGIGAGSSTLPDAVVQMVANNDLQGVLKYMSSVKTTARSSPFVRIKKAIAQALLDMGLNTKIKIVDKLGKNVLAQYDPATDTILVTREGLSSSTILHEIIHAGTVKVINEYLNGDRKSLSLAQLNAIKVLEKIMNETRDLSETHPNAYKDLFEFVSYALSDEQLQQDLHDASFVYPETKGLFEFFGLPREDVQSILPDTKSAWTAFKLSVARILKVRGTYLPKVGKPTKDVEPNFVMEIAAAFEDLLAKPTTPIYLPALPAKIPRLPSPPPLPKLFKKSKKGAAAAPAAAPAAQPTEEETRAGGVNNAKTRKFYELSPREKIVSTPRKIWRSLTTAAGWKENVRRFQDRSVYSRNLYRQLEMSDLINSNMDEAFNNWDVHRLLGTGEAVNFVNHHLRVPMDNIKQSVNDYVRMTGQKLEDALIDLHMFSEMFHEPERRKVKWVTSVGLNTEKNIIHNGKPISAAERRTDILGDPRTGKPGIIHRMVLTEAQQKQLWDELTYLANNYADRAGDSPRIKNERMRERVKVIDNDMNSSTYNVLGINQDEVNLRMQEYKALPDEQKQLLDKIFAEAQEITKITTDLNKIGNFWAFPVTNLVGMYNYQHYLPFKGRSKSKRSDDMTSFDTKVTGADLQETEYSADGRFSASDNPFLQMMSDAFRSAGRAGRRNYMQALKNAVKPNKYNPTGTGVIEDGEVVAHIEFAEKNVVDLKEFKGGSNIFVNNPDGSIDIIRIKDPKLLDALRYSFREESPVLDMANSVTGFFGAMHTRYNYNFAPLNFVRDSLTNAWTMGAELGPTKSAQYINTLSATVVKNGLSKAMEVAILHEKGDLVSERILADLARKDPFVRDMVELLQRGGKTTYMQSFSLKSNMEDLDIGLGKRRIIDKVEKFNKFVDVWNDMFELTSRTAAFSLRKKELVKKYIAQNMTEEAANIAAGTEAAAWTKNLANFEMAGEYAREMGAAYMFIRASATGAVRAAESTIPAFRPLSWAVENLPSNIRPDKDGVSKNPEALEAFKANYLKQQRSAQIMVGALIGSGMVFFYMSALMAPDDEWKRNAVLNDNMGQWTRFVRFHIPNSVSEKLGIGRDVVFQIPWGFGLGAFAAIGAQFAGFTVGASSAKEMFGNVFTSFADSFLPLPLSKIPPTESLESAGKWAIDTVTPTTIRPILEFAMNTNGIGQAINSAATRRMGDAFTGGDRIPEAYKDAAERMFEKSLGSIDVSPNTLYFFANSYLDGLAKVGEILYSWVSLDKGEKAFNIKTDVPLIGSFFGAKVNVDSREYGEIEKQILKIDKLMNTLERRDDLVLLARYEAKNPLHGALVDAYRSRQGELNRLRAEAREIRTMPGLSPKTRDELLRISTMQQNVLKYQMVQDFKALGMER
jgi:hypothetical protein